MPTPSEQKALAFVAIVIVLGGAVRVLRAGAPPTPTVAEQQAVARQAYAAESASQRDSRGKNRRRSGRMAPQRRDAGVNIVGGVASVPYSNVRPGPTDAVGGQAGLSSRGFPPPSPRIDLDNRLPGGMVVAGASATNGVGRSRAGWTSAGPIDLDVASAAEIEALPRIGPALAARIIRSRDSLGPFGSLQGLRRVRGIGPAMLRELGPLVTFSGRAASFDVQTRY
jgi:hypothetical protein